MAESPKISGISWGNVTVGQTRYKDAKLYPGGSRKWDWNETGTRHDPGIQPDDVEELLEHGAEEVVLSRGMYRRLNVKKDTKEYLEQRNIPYHILETRQAVEKYNSLCETRRVGALIHSTC